MNIWDVYQIPVGVDNPIKCEQCNKEPTGSSREYFLFIIQKIIRRIIISPMYRAWWVDLQLNLLNLWKSWHGMRVFVSIFLEPYCTGMDWFRIKSKWIIICTYYNLLNAPYSISLLLYPCVRIIRNKTKLLKSGIVSFPILFKSLRLPGIEYHHLIWN